MRALALLLALALPALADEARPSLLRDVGVEQRLGAALPPDLAFRDEGGGAVRLRDLLDGRPVILSLVYYGCPMMCGQLLDGLVGSLKGMSLEAGKEFTILTVSFDPTEGPEFAAAKKAAVLAHYRRPAAGAGWHFLTADADTIARLTGAVGFRFAYDRAIDQFAHLPVLIVLTPEGKISRYFYGIDFAPRDLRLGLVEASDNRIGTLADQLLLFCYHYDPATGRYGAAAVNAVRGAGALTLLVLGAYLAVSWRRAAVGG